MINSVGTVIMPYQAASAIKTASDQKTSGVQAKSEAPSDTFTSESKNENVNIPKSSGGFSRESAIRLACTIGGVVAGAAAGAAGGIIGGLVLGAAGAGAGAVAGAIGGYAIYSNGHEGIISAAIGGAAGMVAGGVGGAVLGASGGVMASVIGGVTGAVSGFVFMSDKMENLFKK